MNACFMAPVVDVIDRCGHSSEIRYQLQPKKIKVSLRMLGVYIAAKDILPALYY